MYTEKITREARIIMLICLVVGGVLLGAGIILDISNLSIFSNTKGLVGLSFVPLSLALVYYLKLRGITRYPQRMKDVIISESDERLVALKNEADAKAFKIIQAAIFLFFMGHTLLFPDDIFESVGWWMIATLLFVALISQAVMAAGVAKGSKFGEEE
jgi:hypothetical protein